MKSDKSTLQNGAGATEHIPLLSIIIPVWNRQDTIERCLDSIFSQDFHDYEILAVDDGSTDKSVHVMTRYDDPRLRVIQHEVNLGSYAARNTGVQHARAEWILKIDSDDALLPGALEVMHELAMAAAPHVGIVGMSYKYDDGTTGPNPPFPKGHVVLQGWLEWVDEAESVDFLPCYRRKVLEQVPFPSDGRGSIQMNLRIAAKWKIRVSSNPGGMVYTDAPNRLGRNKPLLLSRKHKAARGLATEEILREFGNRMKVHSPHLYQRLSYKVGWWYLLGGKRFKGGMNMLKYILRWPLDLKTWGWLVIGLIGPGALCWVIKKRSRS